MMSYTEMKNNVMDLVLQGNGEKVIDSREVAVMCDMNHCDLLKKLDGTDKVIGIIPTLGKSNFTLAEYYIESTYKDAQGKSRKCYLCTKKGCEMIAHKMTGEKGIVFTAKYIEKFNVMEQYINKPLMLVAPEDYESALEALLEKERERKRLALELQTTQVQLIDTQTELDNTQTELADEKNGHDKLRTLTDIVDILKSKYGFDNRLTTTMLNCFWVYAGYGTRDKQGKFVMGERFIKEFEETGIVKTNLYGKEKIMFTEGIINELLPIQDWIEHYVRYFNRCYYSAIRTLPKQAFGSHEELEHIINNLRGNVALNEFTVNIAITDMKTKQVVLKTTFPESKIEMLQEVVDYSFCDVYGLIME